MPSGIQALMRVILIYPLRLYIRFAPWAFGRLFLFNALAEHLWWLETSVTAKTVYGDVLTVDASDIVGKHIFYFGVWEPHLTRWIRKRLAPGQVFIDVGANIGYYTLLASRLVGRSGHVVSIEALPQTFIRLQDNLQQNDATNVRAINSAAWDKSEQLKLFVRQEGPSGASTLMSAWASQWQLRRQVDVDAAPLGSILTAWEIQTARLIKIDVEGAEWRVISEMTQWLGRTAPALEIAIEISRSMMTAHGKSFEDVLVIFAEFGFIAYRIENDYLAASCIAWNTVSAPHQITSWPSEAIDQIDVIFSRANPSQL